MSTAQQALSFLKSSLLQSFHSPRVKQMGNFIKRGARIAALDEKRKWQFVATAQSGEIQPGQVLGYVEEVPGFKHYILVPPTVQGQLAGLKSGTFTVNDAIGIVTG